MSMIFGPLEYLSLREQFRLLEIAHESVDYRIKQNAIEILHNYRHPPAPAAAPTEPAKADH